MTEILGDAVYYLRGEPRPLIQALREAETYTRAATTHIGQDVDRMDRQLARAGQSANTRFAEPMGRAMAKTDMGTQGAISNFGLLDKQLKDTGAAFELAMSKSCASLNEIAACSTEMTSTIVRDSATTIQALGHQADAWRDLATAQLQAAATRPRFADMPRSLGAAPMPVEQMIFARQQGIDTRGASFFSQPQPAMVPRGGEAFVGTRGPNNIGGPNNPMTVAIEAGQYTGLASRASPFTMGTPVQNVDSPQGEDFAQLTQAIEQNTVATNDPSQPDSSDFQSLQSTMQMLANAMLRHPAGGPPGGGGLGTMFRRPVALEPGPRLMLPSTAETHREAISMGSIPGDVYHGVNVGRVGGDLPVRLTATQYDGFLRDGAADRDAYFRASQATDDAMSRYMERGPLAELPQIAASTKGTNDNTASMADSFDAMMSAGRSGDARAFAAMMGGRPPPPPPPGPPGGPGGPGGSGGQGGDSGGGGWPAWLTTLMFGDRFGFRRLGGGFGRGLGPFGMGIPIAGAGIGSLASFAGLGAEHFAMTGIGLAGSAAEAGIGAGAIGLGELGKMAVGGGADIAAFKTAQASITNTTSAIDKYNTAVATFGKNSTQAQTALKEMNFAIKDMPASLRAQNLAIAKTNLALEDLWKNSMTGAVRNVNFMVIQGQRLAKEYIPMIGQAAQANTTIIRQGMQPLFNWLAGPNGIGIFQNLEDNFKRTLPTAVDAFVQGMEVLLRVTSLASNYTGGFIGKLDQVLRRLNARPDEYFNQYLQRVIGDFHVWEGFVVALTKDIYYLFHQDVQTGQSIVVTLTQMLNKLGEWEKSTRGASQLHTIFEVHKQEVLELLRILPLLVNAFAPIYMAVAPDMTRALTAVLSVVLDLVHAFEHVPGGAFILGLGLISAKLFGVKKTADAVKESFNFLSKAFRDGAGAARANTAATDINAGAQKKEAGATADSTAAADAKKGALRKNAAAEGEDAAATDANTVSQGAEADAMGGAAASAVAESAALDELAASQTAAGATGEAGALGALGGGLTGMFKGTSGRLAGLLGRIPGVSEGAAAGAAPGLLAGGAGFLGGDLLQHLIPGLKHGTTATIGAGALGGGIGFGLGGPIGAAIGAGIGSTLGPTFWNFINGLSEDHRAITYGQDFAKKWVSGYADFLPRGLAAAQQKAVQASATSFQRAVDNARTPQSTTAPSVAGRFGPVTGPVTGSRTPGPIGTPQQVQAAADHLGTVAGQAFVKGLQSVPYPSRGIITEDFTKRLSQLPAQARPKALEAMLSYAEGLQASGKLPEGSMAKIIQGIENQFPGLARYLEGNVKEIGSSWVGMMNPAEHSLEGAIHNIRLNFGALNIDKNVTGQNLLKNMGTSFSDLRLIIRTSTGQTRQEAISAFKQLKDQSLNEMTGMQKSLSQQALLMKDHLISNSAGAQAGMERNFNQLVTTDDTLFKHHVISIHTYMSEIEHTLNSLSKLGGNEYWTNIQDSLDHVNTLYNKHLVTTKQYWDSLQGLEKNALNNIVTQNRQHYDQVVADAKKRLQQQLADAKGNQAQQQAAWKAYYSKVDAARAQENATTASQLQKWAQSFFQAAASSGHMNWQGLEALRSQMNQLLGSLNAHLLPQITQKTVQNTSTRITGGGTQNLGTMGHNQQGGLYQFGGPGQRGADTINASMQVAPGEVAMIATGDQHYELNRMARTFGYGGLDDFFHTHNRPHGGGVGPGGMGHYATGGYVYPIAPGVPIGRTDQGVDPQAPAGKPFGPIGDAIIHSTSIGGWPGGPYMFWQLTNGPMAGRFVYLAEMIRPTVRPGEHVHANETIAISTGPSQEMGWAVSSGATLARATSGYTEGAVTPAGSAFRAFLTGLSHGKLVGGGGFFMDTNLKLPNVSGAGPLHDQLAKGYDRINQAWQPYIQKKMAAMMPAGGSFTGSFASRGPTEDRIAADLRRVGFNKVAIAGILGNAYAESGINPASRGSGGGGLWGFTPFGPVEQFAASRHTSPNDVDTQVAFMLNQWFAENQSAVSALNSQGSPTAAAVYFMNSYERPGNPRTSVRTAAADQAYSQGYAQGGVERVTKPTLALFGEAGPETAVFIPGNVDVVNSRQSGGGGHDPFPPWDRYGAAYRQWEQAHKRMLAAEHPSHHPRYYGGPGGEHYRGHNLPGQPPQRGVPWNPTQPDWPRWGDFINDLLWGGKDAKGPMKQLHGMRIPQLERLLQDFPQATEHWGPDVGIEHQLGDLHRDLTLTHKAEEARIDQAQRLAREAQNAHGDRHKRLLAESRAAREQAHDDALHGQAINKQIAALEKKFNDSVPGKTLADIRQILMQDLNKQISQLTKIASAEDTLAQTIQSVEQLPRSTHLPHLLGISPRELRQLGLPTHGGGTRAYDRELERELATDRKELRDLEQEMRLATSPQQRKSLHSKIEQLIQSMVGLKGSIDQNKKSVDNNTNAITGSQTGTTAFTYNGQGYLASDTGINLAVGS